MVTKQSGQLGAGGQHPTGASRTALHSLLKYSTVNCSLLQCSEGQFSAVQCIAWMCGAGPTVRGLIVTLPGQGENSDQEKGEMGKTSTKIKHKALCFAIS